MEYFEIKQKLKSLAKEDYKTFSLALVPNAGNMLGVKIPDLTKLAKEIASADYKRYFSQAKDDSFEEIMLRGLVICNIKTDLNEVFDLLFDYIEKIKNWSHCDTVVTHLKLTKKHPKEFLDFIKILLNSKSEFALRFAIVMLLSYYINDEYLDFCFLTFDEIKHEGYYVKMAVAWAVQKAITKHRAETLRYLQNNGLDDKTFNLCIRKISESQNKNIDKELKNSIKKMKR